MREFKNKFIEYRSDYKPHFVEWKQSETTSAEDAIDWLVSRFTLQRKEMREMVEGRKDIEDIISRHNARILNEFQLQGKPDMPMIAYDERICLIPAMEKATKETLDDLATALREMVVENKSVTNEN
mgnify:FL=1